MKSGSSSLALAVCFCFRCIGLLGAYLIQTTNQFVEIHGHFRFKSELCTAEGVLEGNRSRMKCQTFVGVIPFPILLVSHYRVSNIGQMYAYLVLPARQQINFQQSKVLCLFEHFVSSVRQFSFCGIGRGVHSVSFVLYQVRTNRLRALLTLAMNDGKIFLSSFLSTGSANGALPLRSSRRRVYLKFPYPVGER